MKTNKPKVIVMTRFPYTSSWGGEESHTLDLAKHFRGKNTRVVFMGSCPILQKKFSEEGFEVIPVWGSKMIVTPLELIKSFMLFPLIMWSMKRAFKKLQTKYKVSAVYCLSLNEKLFLTPYILQENIPVTWVEHQEIRRWLLKSPWRKRYQRNAHQVKIIPISKKNERVLRDELHIPEENMQFINNGVDVKSYTPSQKRKGSLLAANRLIPKKGVTDIIDALALIKEKEKFSARILGEGEEESLVKEKIQQLKSSDIHFDNFLKKENWKKALSKSEIFVSSARDSNETFSLNCAEALASGCKLVVTSCTGIADFLQGQKGVWICQPNNPKDMAEKIQRALHEDEDLSKELAHVAEQQFNQEMMHQKYFSLILR